MKFDENFKSLIINFIIELNDSYKFKVSSEKILKIFDIYGKIDVFNEQELMSVLKSILCTSKLQYDMFDKIFKCYFQNLKNKTKYEAEKFLITENINNLSKQLDSTKNEYQEEKEQLFQNIYSFDEKNIALLKNILKEINCESDIDILEKIISNDKDVFKELTISKEKTLQLQNDLEKVISYNIENDFDENFCNELINVSITIKENFHKYDELQKNKSTEITEIEKTIEKLESKQHREEFTEGRNAVKCENGSLEKDFSKLDDKDFLIIYKYIIENTNKLRTRLNKRFHQSKNEKFDYKKVIKNAIKTDMVPIELFFKKQTKTKTKIICITDISGSCKKASQILLSFVYALQEVFPAGVESFVFVKQLKESTNIFKNYSIEEANERTSVLVERNYSNYYNALKEFDENYFDRITKDTIVIFLGDARNNNNQIGTEYLKKIQDKISCGNGKIYWLDPEPVQKWDKGDSIISQYSKYTNKTFCIECTNDILKFLNEI